MGIFCIAGDLIAPSLSWVITIYYTPDPLSKFNMKRHFFAPPTSYSYVHNDIMTFPSSSDSVTFPSFPSFHSLFLSSVLLYLRNYTSDLSAEFIAYKAMVVSGQDSGFGSLMGRLEAALSVDAFDNESVVKKCSNSSIRRKESKIRRAKRREEEGADYPEYPLKGVEETEDIVEDDI